MTANQQKYRETILYLCENLGGEIKGKKKLAKLLYFADFDSYEKDNHPITGDQYRALPMGPFPIRLEEITAAMQKEGTLVISRVEEYGSEYAPTEVYRGTNGERSGALLTSADKIILDRVIKKYGALSGKQLEDLSHQEAPYVATEPQKEIPYELSYYRGTDFSEV